MKKWRKKVMKLLNILGKHCIKVFNKLFHRKKGIGKYKKGDWDMFLNIGCGLILALLSLPVMAEYNSTAIQDITTTLNFRADSIRYSDVIQWSANENKSLMVLFNDTNAPGAGVDTVKFHYGYQRGFTTINSNGKLDTTWRNLVALDTVSTLPADTAGKWINNTNIVGTDKTTGYESVTKGLMDTSYVTGYTVVESSFSPKWSGLARGWVKGLTGNSTLGWIKLKLHWAERPFMNVRTK
jgi:hypothetical protein